MTAPEPAVAAAPHAAAVSVTPKCRGCGTTFSTAVLGEEAQRRIAELETQVRMLEGRSPMSSSAAEKLPPHHHSKPATSAAAAAAAAAVVSQPHPSSPSSIAALSSNRISAFLSAVRRAPPSPPPDAQHPLPVSSSSSSNHTPSNSTGSDPQAELARERELRMKAEERLSQVTSELEDLSASLFQSANEMVAEERRARSRLEERVSVLERREKEKGERLGVLERAVERIGRVRDVLMGGTTAVSAEAAH